MNSIVTYIHRAEVGYIAAVAYFIGFVMLYIMFKPQGGSLFKSASTQEVSFAALSIIAVTLAMFFWPILLALILLYYVSMWVTGKKPVSDFDDDRGDL